LYQDKDHVKYLTPITQNFQEQREFQGRLAFRSRLDFLVQQLYIEVIEVETAGLVGSEVTVTVE
jgi:hypothetical protein